VRRGQHRRFILTDIGIEENQDVTKQEMALRIAEKINCIRTR